MVKMRKKQKEYELEINQKVNDIQGDLQARSRELHDTINSINHEYTKMMDTLSDKQKRSLSTLTEAVKEQQKKTDASNTDATDEPPT